MRTVFSSATFQDQREPAVLGIIRIVIEPRDFKRPELQHAARRDFFSGALDAKRWLADFKAFEARQLDAAHTCDGLRRSNDATRIDAIAEGQIVAMKQSLRAVGQQTIAEDVEQCCLDVPAQIFRQNTDAQREIDADILRLLDLHIVSDPAVWI